MDLTKAEEGELLYHEALHKAVELYEMVAGKIPLASGDYLADIRDDLLELIRRDEFSGNTLRERLAACDGQLEFIR